MNEPDQRLDQRLRGAFVPPDREHFERLARAVTKPASRRRWPLVLLAALLLVALTLLWTRRDRLLDRSGVTQADAIAEVSGPLETSDGARLGSLWLAAYDDALRGGFGTGCCEPGDFASACRERFGCSLSFDGGAAGGVGPVRMLGCYCGESTGEALALLVDAGGEPVFVAVLPRDRDPGARVPDNDGVVASHRQLGELNLYSLTLDAPREGEAVLAQFSMP